jgi:hypothetical protein
MDGVSRVGKRGYADVGSCGCYLRRQICNEIFGWLWSGPKVVRWVQLMISGHGDVVVLVGPGPGPCPGESCSTVMLHRTPVAGRRREHFCESHCLRETRLIHVGCRWQLAGSVEGSGTGGLHCPMVGCECARGAAPTAASGWPAQLRVQPG